MEKTISEEEEVKSLAVKISEAPHGKAPVTLDGKDFDAYSL